MEKTNQIYRPANIRSLVVAAIMLIGMTAGAPIFGSNDRPEPKNKKSIAIIYFSHSGNTRTAAKKIHSRVGGTLIEIETVVPYPNDYGTLSKQAKKELSENFRPQLANNLEDIPSCDTIFVGYPIWWGTMPPAMFSLFEKINFKGKTIIPFSTQGSSGFGRSLTDIKKLNPDAKILQGLAVQGRSVKDAATQAAIDAWLAELGFSAEKKK